MAKRLLVLNGAAIVCVVLFHAAGFGFTAMFSWAHRYRPVTSPNYDEAGTIAYFALRSMEELVSFAIPTFLFVSGYFITVLTGRRQVPSAQAVATRIRHLVVPYLIWSAIVLLALAMQGRIFSEGRYVRLLLTGSANPNYYYVPLLVQFYLVAPAIVFLVRRNWRLLLIATGVLQVFVYLLQYAVVLGSTLPLIRPLAAMLPKWLFVAQLFWFTFGVVAGFESSRLKSVLKRIKWVLPPSVAVLFLLGVFEWEFLLRASGNPWVENRLTLVDGLYAGACLLTFLAYTEITLPFSNALVALGTRSYGIYLVHGLAMEFLARGLYHFAPWVLGRQLLLQPMLIAVGLAVPLGLMFLIGQSASRGLYSHLFG